MVSEKRDKYIFEVFTSFEELENVREFWDKYCNIPTVDYDFYKQITLLKGKEEGVSPFVIKIGGSDNKIFGLLVGRKELKDVNINIGYYSLCHLKVRGITILYGGILGDFTEEDTIAIVKYLLKILRQYKITILSFNFLDSSTPFVKYLNKASLLKTYFPTKILHWKMDVPENINVFYSKFSHKHRYWLKRMAKVIESEFKDRLKIEIISENKNIEEVSKKIEYIASKTYQRKIGAGFRDDDLNRARLRVCADKGGLRVYLLTIDSEPAAFWDTTIYKGVCYLNFTGYLKKYEKYEIGTYLLLQCIVDLSKEKCAQSIDFGFGDALYKQRFGDIKWEEKSLEIYSFSFSGIIFYLLDNFIKFINFFFKMIVEKTRLFPLIKRYWRNLLKKGADKNS